MTEPVPREADIIIVGHGLAGATLALTLIARGLRVIVVDDDTRRGASRVAAGLMTPVTGGKLKPQPDFDALMAVAATLYDAVGNAADCELLIRRPALRLLAAPRELAAWASADAKLTAKMLPFGGVLPDAIRTAEVSTLMPDAARLDVSAFLDVTRARLAASGAWLTGTVAANSIATGTDSIRINTLGIRARRIVFCRGYGDHDNPFFPTLAWRPAKGQILTVRCDALDERFTVHGNGLWLTPVAPGRFLVGATYEWDTLDNVPTDEGRDTMLERLHAVVDADVTVESQAAAVRPIVAGRMPVIGASPLQHNVYLFNGLGSKGALFAPTVASELAAHLVDDQGIDPGYCLASRINAAHA